MIAKEQVLEAAIEVFSQVGYSQTTIQDIATKAKVGKGSIYIFFDSKAEILFEACKTHIGQCTQEMLQLLHSSEHQNSMPDLMNSLIAYSFLDIIPFQSKACFLIYELLVLAAVDANYHQKIGDLLNHRQHQAEDIFMQIYKNGVQKEEFCSIDYPLEFFRAFLATVDGLIYQHTFRPNELNLESLVKSEQAKFKKILYKKGIYA